MQTVNILFYNLHVGFSLIIAFGVGFFKPKKGKSSYYEDKRPVTMCIEYGKSRYVS